VRLRDGRLRQSLGEAARARFEQSFTLEQMIRRYQDLYRSVVSR
jgi:glycosyltransferase involved in cell wall biosynthesis